jgi:glutaredoxin
MKKKFKKSVKLFSIFISLFILFSLNLSLNQTVSAKMLIENNSNNENSECLHLFYKEDCPQCSNTLNFLDELEKDYDINIEKYDINIEENKIIYKKFKEQFGLVTGSYPIVFIGNNYLIGDKSIRNHLEDEIIYCQNNDCTCPLLIIKGSTPAMPKTKDITPEDPSLITLPLFGEVNFSKTPIFFTTAIIAFVDGFNPCSLWLITFLIGIVIYTRSKRKLLIVGGTFLIVTGAVYALFMAGLLNVFSYVAYLKWIQIAVAIMAAIFAVVNIKDYFWYKKGLSFTISDKYKPKIFRNMRGIMKADKSIWQMIVGTIILALGVVLIELPCTAGFPVIWTNILAQNNISGSFFYSLLLVYMLIYLLDEIIVLLIATITMRAGKFEEKHGRMLKLIGGLIMLALAIVMIIDPNLMHNISGSLIVFAGAILTSFIIIFIHRKILPKYGIKIGTEKEVVDKDNNN